MHVIAAIKIRRTSSQEEIGCRVSLSDFDEGLNASVGRVGTPDPLRSAPWLNRSNGHGLIVSESSEDQEQGTPFHGGTPV